MAKNHKNVCKNNGHYFYALMPNEKKSVKKQGNPTHIYRC